MESGMATRLVCSVILLLVTGGLVMSQTRGEIVQMPKLFLHDNWSIQSSVPIKENGSTISTKDFEPRGWYPATVPSTIIGTLVEDGVYRDPMVDMNLRQIPGCSYPVGANFSNVPMPQDSPFRSSWWYRTEFHMPVGYAGKNIWLHFDGINFRANVWLNGR